MKIAPLLFVSLSAVSLHAENWSIGVATGPFVFGDFIRQTLRVGTETGSEMQTVILSAATRPGLSVDAERRFSDRFAIRAEASFTRSPLAVKGDRDDTGVSLDAGDMDVATFMVPIVFRINRGGAIRFHLLGGPSYAGYRVAEPEAASGTIRIFEGTRWRWGWAGGGGAAWLWSEHLAVEGQLIDISTSSPFSGFTGIGRIEIPRTHNVHTTLGLRYRF